MKEYHKIQSIFKRDPETKFKTFLDEYSIPEFEYLKDNKWIWTEKVDGTNIRVMWDPCPIGTQVMFAGRTGNAQIPTFLFSKLQEVFTPDLFKDEFAEQPITLYGEGYGAKIQKGGGNYIPDGVDFILFDILIGEWWLKREDVEELAGRLGLDVVPIVGEGTLDDAISYVKSSPKSRWGDFNAEGIVLKPAVELKARNGQRIITKLKHKDFWNEA
jgi:ATP-dependent RNA circularization protein (DNA/RNA ligase family)